MPVAKPNGDIPAPSLKRPGLYPGVRFIARSLRWQAVASIGGHTRVIGTYATEIAAARAYDNFLVANGLDPDFPSRSRRRMDA